jgi:hypothetical protein
LIDDWGFFSTDDTLHYTTYIDPILGTSAYTTLRISAVIITTLPSSGSIKYNGNTFLAGLKQFK